MASLELSERPDSLDVHFRSLFGLLNTYGPERLAEVRQRAFDAFRTVGMPTTRDEEFRYLPLRDLAETALVPAYGLNLERSDLESTLSGSVDAITLTFVNGQIAPELSNEEVLPKGVYVGSILDGYDSAFADVLDQHLLTVATYEGKLGSTNDPRFVDLNTAYLSEGAFVYVSPNVTVERPIHIVFLSKDELAPFVAHPRVLLVMGENAEAKVIESFAGLGGTYWNNAVTEVVMSQSARLEYVRVQDESAGAFHIGNVFVHQEANSVFTSNAVSFGARLARVDINVFGNGEHTETWLNGVYVAKGTQVSDHHTRIDHAKANCNSFEVYKGVLDGESTGVFNGKIFVYEDAQKTDAKQTNQALLLSPNATINTKPQLEIFADDVKCTHGATVGQLRQDALFYLRARGIPLKEAQGLLVYAFANEVLEKITIDDLRERLEKALFERLGTA